MKKNINRFLVLLSIHSVTGKSVFGPILKSVFRPILCNFSNYFIRNILIAKQNTPIQATVLPPSHSLHSGVLSYTL